MIATNLLKLAGFAAVFSELSVAQVSEVALSSGTSGTWNAEWNGVANRTDFIQWSLDLEDWHYMPVVEHGTGLKSYGFASSTDKFFVRLQHAAKVTTDAANEDYDGDYLTNIDEVTSHDTDPTKWDTDDDGLSDTWEIENNLDPRDDGSINPENGPAGDPDGDGFINIDEYFWNANPHSNDTDGDGLSDADEAFLYGTSPIYDDSDSDGLSDGEEFLTYGTDPNHWDTDGDTLDDGVEVIVYGTDPTLYDTDGDWMPDDWEIDNNLDPLDSADGLLDSDSDTLPNQLEYVFLDQGYDPFISNAPAGFPWGGDSDYDGLTTSQEFNVHLTNPRQPDTDDDGMDDGWEIKNGFSALVHNSKDSNPGNDEDADPDGDGINNQQESAHGTKANNADSDDDGVNDDVEIAQGSNPNDPNDFNPPPKGTMPVSVDFGDPSGSHSEKYRVRLHPTEGDSQVRERSNRKYGQTQTDTFHLPKGAKYTITLVHIGTDPKYRSTPKPDYDYKLTITSGGGDADSTVVTSDPQGMLGNHSESTPFFASGKAATLYTALITSETVVSIPSDRERTKIGVNEKVNLTLKPDSLPSPTWALTGDKELSLLSQTTGITNQLEAGARNCAPVAEATINGKVVRLAFTVVEPSGIVMRQQPGTGIEHTNGIPSAGFTGNPYITPDDVSFAGGGVNIREGTCNATLGGYYSYVAPAKRIHNTGPWRAVITGDSTNPSKVGTSDHIYSGNDGPTTPSVGFFEWIIPMEFQVNGGAVKQFTTITHRQDCDSAGTVTIQKGAGPFSAQLNEPTHP